MKQYRFGILTPSSNTALEPLTAEIVSQVPGITAHFSRFSVTEIALHKDSLGQFDNHNVLSAARLLADARVNAIGWSGTSASWLGFDHDVSLCQRIKSETGITATTSILAINEILAKYNISSFGLVTPYTSDVQHKIIDNYQNAGFNIISESHSGISENFAYAEISKKTLTDQVYQVAEAGAPAIVIACTNLCSANLVSQWENELGIPILDSTITVVWKMLQMTTGGIPRLSGWGRLMAGELSYE